MTMPQTTEYVKKIWGQIFNLTLIFYVDSDNIWHGHSEFNILGRIITLPVGEMREGIFFAAGKTERYL